MNRKTRIITILGSIVSLILVAFFSYYGFTSQKVEEFMNLEPGSLELEGELIDIDGTDIHYIKYGDGDRKIILIHGIGAGTFSYRKNIKELAKHYEVYAIDLKGFGYSERAPGTDYTYREQASLILGFMDKKDIPVATIIGHSMGGAISLIAYDISPGSFESIVLIDSAGLSSHNRSLGSFVTRFIVDIIYYHLIMDRDNFKGFLKSAYYDKSFVDEGLVEIYNRPFRLDKTNRSYISILRSDNRYDFSSIIKSIDVPVLVIWGEQDTWIDKKDAYLFDDMIKDASLLIVPDSGHLPMEEKSGEVNSAILDFLKDNAIY